MTAQVVLHRGKAKLQELLTNPQIRKGLLVTGYALGGFFLSAAAVRHRSQPLAMALVSVMTGWRALVMALGAALGYRVFWGEAGFQGMLWSVLGGLTALFLGKGKLAEKVPLLIPALCGLWVSASGLLFQILGENTPVGIYLLRITLGAAGSRLFALVKQRKSPILDWIAEGAIVLALAQVVIFGWINLGAVAAGALAMAEAFPAAALAGMALDLGNVTDLPMTAVVCTIYLFRLVPGLPDWVRKATPALVGLMMMALLGTPDPKLLTGLLLGGLASGLLPERRELSHRRGETGVAQVRLELMAGVLSQMQQLLLEMPEVPVDQSALLARTRERACGSCPNRKTCSFSGPLPENLLRKPLLDCTALPFPCKKPGRMILELRRTQEQFRRTRGERDRQREWKQAVTQQYRFLSEFLRDLSDQLPRKAARITAHYQPEAAVASVGKEPANGDTCLRFPGTGCRYYVLLCDGMGTGTGAAQEAKTGATLLKQMLCAGFPAEYALESLNSLLALRGRAGAVTVDLAEIRLDMGKATLYKWGAAPSYLLTGEGLKKIGTAGPPPGIDIGSTRQTVERLSLRRGETLILVSDGLEAGETFPTIKFAPAEPPGELAERLLRAGARSRRDDATAAVVRLCPAGLST